MPAQEMLDQIALTRAQNGATGNVYFSMRSLMFGRDGLPEKMVAGPYATRALVPASTWLDSVPPAAPIVRSGRDAGTGARTLSLQPQGTEATWCGSSVLILETTGRRKSSRDYSDSHASPGPGGTEPDAVSVSAVTGTATKALLP